VHIEELLDERAAAALAFGRKRKHLREEPRVRDIETIDAELRPLLIRAWRVARLLNDRIPSRALIDQLLDERAAALDRALSGPAANSPGSRR
jgi:hypothetical protein